MIESISAFFSLDFVLRALTVGTLVSLCAALLGVSLVLKRYSMIGDGLSHVGFGALSIAAAANLAPMQVAIPVVILAAFLLLRISGNRNIRGDAAIALLSTGALAVGIMVVSASSGNNIDVYNYMFGSILAVTGSDVKLSVLLSAAVLLLFVLFYNKIFAITFDEDFAKATGTPTGIYNMLIALLTAVTVVLAMRLMGTLLISSLLIFPGLTAMRICKSFRSVVILSAAVSVLCVVIGLWTSYLYSTPAGASIVVVNICFFFLFWIAGRIRRGIGPVNLN